MLCPTLLIAAMRLTHEEGSMSAIQSWIDRDDAKRAEELKTKPTRWFVYRIIFGLLIVAKAAHLVRAAPGATASRRCSPPAVSSGSSKVRRVSARGRVPRNPLPVPSVRPAATRGVVAPACGTLRTLAFAAARYSLSTWNRMLAPSAALTRQGNSRPARISHNSASGKAIKARPRSSPRLMRAAAASADIIKGSAPT